jgi:hypothetical protein
MRTKPFQLIVTLDEVIYINRNILIVATQPQFTKQNRFTFSQKKILIKIGHIGHLVLDVNGRFFAASPRVKLPAGGQEEPDAAGRVHLCERHLPRRRAVERPEAELIAEHVDAVLGQMLYFFNVKKFEQCYDI